MNKIAELKSHYSIGWKSNENLRRFPKRLDEEQSSLQLYGVTIDNDEKFIHYLRKLYRSGTFTDETDMEWNNIPTADQMYANAIILFEKKKDGMGKVCRITGNTNSVRNCFIRVNATI